MGEHMNGAPRWSMCNECTISRANDGTSKPKEAAGMHISCTPVQERERDIDIYVYIRIQVSRMIKSKKEYSCCYKTHKCQLINVALHHFSLS